MSSLRRRRTSPAALPPLEDDNLLSEILLRLPPQPSSLPRASLVCKRWRCLVSDPGFCRRFRRHHRRNPSLLGFFQVDHEISFIPTLSAPDRVSPERFSLQHDGGRRRFDFVSLGCRHGLALFFLQKPLQLLVWDPVTGDQRHIALPAAFDTTKTRIGAPPGFGMDESPISGAVLRSAGGAGDVHHFQVVLVGIMETQIMQVVAFIYLSETGVWGNLITTPLQCEDPAHYGIGISTVKPAVLIRGSLYWLLTGSSEGILELDMDRQELAAIPMPVNGLGCFHMSMVRADGGGLGLGILSGCSAQFWNRTTNCDGVASWVLGRTINKIDKLLHLKAEDMRSQIILGCAQDNDVVVLWTIDGPVMFHLESLQFEKFLGTNILAHYHSFESVYTTALVVDMMELIFCTTHKIFVRLDMLM